MFFYVCFGFLAAFGLLSFIWVLIGLILPPKHLLEVAIICPNDHELTVIKYFCRFRELGLHKITLIVLNSCLSEHQQRLIGNRYPYIRFHTIDIHHGRGETDIDTGS